MIQNTLTQKSLKSEVYVRASQGLWGAREFADFLNGNMSKFCNGNRNQNGFWGAIRRFF